MSTKAVFLDKDGTLIKDMPYNVDPELIELTQDAVEELQLLHAAGYRGNCDYEPVWYRTWIFPRISINGGGGAIAPIISRIWSYFSWVLLLSPLPRRHSNKSLRLTALVANLNLVCFLMQQQDMIIRYATVLVSW